MRDLTAALPFLDAAFARDGTLALGDNPRLRRSIRGGERGGAPLHRHAKSPEPEVSGAVGYLSAMFERRELLAQTIAEEKDPHVRSSLTELTG